MPLPFLSCNSARCLSGLLLLAGLSQCNGPVNSTAQTRVAPAVADFNQDWQFVKDVDTTIVASYFNQAGSAAQWAPVSLPHTPRIEPVAPDQPQWQGISFYRKFFRVPTAGPGGRVAIAFGAAMHTADVYLNGQRLQRHVGGYLPFTVDISRQVKPGAENTLLVRLDNRDSPVVPPGKPLKGLDFNFYGGLYRPARLILSDPLHIADAVQANRVAGGGLLLHYENVSAQSATLHLQTDVQNDATQAQTAQLRTVLLDEKGREVARATSVATSIAPGAFAQIKQQLAIARPQLWSPDQPYRYRAVVEVLRDGKVIDRQETSTGVRSIGFAAESFTLNGQPLRLRGTNRHQEYPYLGYAISDNAQYRDAWKIKDAGFNFVRCSHYPPSEAFLQACDELGILVMDSAPGWQFFGNAEFQQNSLQDIRDMVRRDRNHPSIVLWEAALNESDMAKPFMEAAHRAVHEELPFAEGVYSCGWLDYAYDVFIPARQHLRAPNYFNKYAKDKPLLICEYGDWEYYAHNAGFNQTSFAGLKESERTSRQLRGQGERALTQQALNFQEAHNDNFRGPAVGDANWLMFDYKRGYAPDIESSGVSDIFRLPKFAYYFYQSQSGPVAGRNGFGQPMVYIASFWQPTSAKRVVVYSNCDEVELLLNGQVVARQRPDTGPAADRLAHAPFTFAVPAFVPGTLRAVAYRGGKAAATAERRTPGAAHHLQLRYDRSGRDAGPQDVLLVYADVVDANGTVLPEATNAIRFALKGGGEIIGNNPGRAEAGIATVLLKTGLAKETVQLTATAEGLADAALKIDIR
ncbi:glycoside hydrolase family 2 protein [Hymenobacter sp. IS2118]|uniref:glycoside hydrolase family 2 protein n=1 Tax=Hymenobacter sp. IS2118 TaxID=1505605 RepID=UPI00054FF93F|nr:glycoside hydrolase family 2 TIM barrel-domain containing protein [Hymenobacter sp. IS2118]